MLNERLRLLSRVALAALVLASGIIMLPLGGLSAETLSWELFVNAYQPEVLVNHASGARDSAFTLTGQFYPPNTNVSIFVDGNFAGTLQTDAQGSVVFVVQTRVFDTLGQHLVTVAADANTLASQSFVLDDNAPIWPPPAGYDGPIIELGQSGIFFPAFYR